MATLVGLVVGRKPLLRTVINPTYDYELNDNRMLGDCEQMRKISADLYAQMTSNDLAALDSWLGTLTNTQFCALTDDDMTTKINVIIAARTAPPA